MRRIVEVALFISGLVCFAVPDYRVKVVGVGLLVGWFLVYQHRTDPPPNGF